MRKNIVITLVAVVGLLAGLFLFIKSRPQAPVSSGVLRSESEATSENFGSAMAGAQGLIVKGEWLAARDELRRILMEHVARPDIGKVQQQLEDVNFKIIFSAIDVPGESVVRLVKKGDSLSMIADEYRTTVAMIQKQNGLTSSVIRIGMPLRIWTGRFTVLVDKSQNLLTLRSNGEVIKTYRVSTGKDNTTPVGTFTIVNKLQDPSWTHDGKVYPPDSPENILGSRWLGFNLPGYGIHGTKQPESIGQQATAGCVRMLNNEVEELFDMLPVNTEVTIID